MSEHGGAGLGRAGRGSRTRAVAVLGGSGFVGRAIVEELRIRGMRAWPVTAPRLKASPAELTEGPSERRGAELDYLTEHFDGADVVINAAGIADPAASDSPALYGANALLPVLAARASLLANAGRLVHVSSISVQGDADLDETSRTAPFSPYSRSRALGEQFLARTHLLDTVIFRPTSIHGPDRAITRSLIRFARSALSCVAGSGLAPTPQVLVTDVATAAAHLALIDAAVPPIVIQPPNGMTTGMLLRLLGGHEPRHLPYRSTRAALRAIRRGTGYSLRATGHTRRLEMLLFGRRQVPGWLADKGMAAELRAEQWRQLAQTVLSATTAPPREVARATATGAEGRSR